MRYGGPHGWPGLFGEDNNLRLSAVRETKFHTHAIQELNLWCDVLQCLYSLKVIGVGGKVWDQMVADTALVLVQVTADSTGIGAGDTGHSTGIGACDSRHVIGIGAGDSRHSDTKHDSRKHATHTDVCAAVGEKLVT